MKKYLWIFLFIFAFSFSSVRVFADTPSTTGIVAGQIWYSEDPLVEGDTVQVYTAVWNGGTTDLSARVEFYDQNVILGTRDVTVSPQELKDVSVSWQVTSGDHIIRAVIESSTITSGGKQEPVTLDRSSTSEDHVTVPVVVKTASGTPVKTADVVSDEIQTATSEVKNAVPASVTADVSSLDAFRNSTSVQIDASKADVQKQIDTLNKVESTTATTSKGKTVSPSNANPTSTMDATQKPIAYIKLFFLSVLSFIFSNKIVFYALLVFVIYLILRFIYRKIRNR